MLSISAAVLALFEARDARVLTDRIGMLGRELRSRQCE